MILEGKFYTVGLHYYTLFFCIKYVYSNDHANRLERFVIDARLANFKCTF